eukprot:CAMPEP_0175749118 /NCGR_PEP_ID=MMETSP0097-20121207/59989_1 /TAXON_ID=311494 /ORGANISM="Alexandrium monilatum, Strain CCMP3105" /LENGTH=112 /DNA_ID=CAMNT_0017057671 /DNA_START=342 /DNA_END=681 /DNA_ORIENTATION=-
MPSWYVAYLNTTRVLGCEEAEKYVVLGKVQARLQDPLDALSQDAGRPHARRQATLGHASVILRRRESPDATAGLEKDRWQRGAALPQFDEPIHREQVLPGIPPRASRHQRQG